MNEKLAILHTEFDKHRAVEYVGTVDRGDIYACSCGLMFLRYDDGLETLVGVSLEELMLKERSTARASATQLRFIIKHAATVAGHGLAGMTTHPAEIARIKASARVSLDKICERLRKMRNQGVRGKAKAKH